VAPIARSSCGGGRVAPNARAPTQEAKQNTSLFSSHEVALSCRMVMVSSVALAHRASSNITIEQDCKLGAWSLGTGGTLHLEGNRTLR
jgi:hypothetical protein